jgi:glycosyltransferase involved in cell wall biosynthesis
MKTILIAHNYSENSFATMSYHLANHLADRGNNVIFISHHPYFSNKQILKKEKGQLIIYSWPTQERPTSAKDAIWFAKIYLKYKPEISIGHFVGSNITISLSKILSLGKTKTFEYYHSLSNQIIEDLQKITFKQRFFFNRKKIFYKLFCDMIICPSQIAKNDLQLFFGVKKGLVILNPMMDRFESKILISNDSIVISYLGRLDPSKGVIDLIQAFEKYKKMTTNSKLILNIAGSGRQELEIIELVKNNDSIHFVGGLSYDKIDNCLNKSHFTIIPSKFDNLPTVGLESMMNQTPLLISNTTGLTDYLVEGKECYKFDTTIDSLMLLFERVENNFDRCEQMGKEARATFLDKFSITEYCNSISDLIL